MNSRLKGSFVALGALLTLSSAAIAADQSIPVYKAAPVIVQAPAFSWTGCYIGGHAGGGWYKSSFIESSNDNGGIGWVGGAQAGCNYQVRQFVFMTPERCPGPRFKASRSHQLHINICRQWAKST